MSHPKLLAKRYPWIVEAALKNRHKQFAIDGETVVLGVDGVATFQRAAFRQEDNDLRRAI